jgi:sigma-B regulation protein RsbU (phosphoserine phosphatase)
MSIADGAAVPSPSLPDSEALFEHAACGLLLTSADGTIRRVNATFCRWVGHAAEDLVGRRKLDSLLTMGGRIFHQTHWAPLLQIQGSVAEVKLDIVHRDGHTIRMMLNAMRREQAPGIPYHWIALFVAEDRHAYERELLQARKRAEELLERHQRAEQALSLVQAQLRQAIAAAEDRALFAEQMVGIVSHDLRNPLSTIQMGAVLLERAGSLDEAQQRALGHIDKANRRAQRLIADLLDFTVARVGRGLVVSPRPVALHTLVAGCVDELAVAFAGRVLQHRSSGEGACVVDADRLAQLIGNLVGNAMSYGAPDRPVTVTSAIEAASFSVAVHNEGTPIPLEQLAGMFEPMTRGDAAGESRSVGLGLFIVREIARAHGGEVAVTSSAEEGTRFVASFRRQAS